MRVPITRNPVAAGARATTTCCPPAVQSRFVEVRAGGDDMLQLLRLQNSDTSSLKPDPSAFLPGTQPLVRAFAGSTYDLADLALRNRHLAAPVRILGLLG